MKVMVKEGKRVRDPKNPKKAYVGGEIFDLDEKSTFCHRRMKEGDIVAAKPEDIKKAQKPAVKQ